MLTLPLWKVQSWWLVIITIITTFTIIITPSLSSSPPSSTTLNKTLPSWRRKLMAALGAGKTDACRAANHFNEGWVGVGGAVFLKMMIMIIIIMKLIWYYDSIVLWLQWPTLLCCYSSSRRTHCWRQSTASARSTAENYLEKNSGTENFIFWRELPDFYFETNSWEIYMLRRKNPGKLIFWRRNTE